MHPFHRKHNGFNNYNSRICPTGKSCGIKRDENGEATLEFDDKFYYRQKEPQVYYQKESSTLTEKENILKSFVLGDVTQQGISPESLTETPATGTGNDLFFSSSTQNSKHILNSFRSTSTPQQSACCTKPLEINTCRDTETSNLSFNVPSIVLSDDCEREENSIFGTSNSEDSRNQDYSPISPQEETFNSTTEVSDSSNDDNQSTATCKTECDDDYIRINEELIKGPEKHNNSTDLDSKNVLQKGNSPFQNDFYTMNNEVEKNKCDTLVYSEKLPCSEHQSEGTQSTKGGSHGDQTKDDKLVNEVQQLILSENQEDNSLLNKILLATNKTISKKWLGEGFLFCTSSATYGLSQSKEGTGGILAAVNAFIIKNLLFNEVKNDVEYLRPKPSQLEPALIKALADILWQAGGNSATLAILKKPMNEITSIEDIIDNMIKKSFASKTELEKALFENITSFTLLGCHGCVLLLISAIMSRGIKNVVDDMNGGSSLISSNGFSSIELVNLLLTGNAVSNVFDNHIKLKYNTIKGISKRSDIGYLSIKEHFKCCKVGSYLKTPRYPIWLVHNENQFAVLFSCQKQLVSDWKVERKFVMYYYDSLQSLENECRLIIDTTQMEDSGNHRDSMKSTVEHCVRTKWKDANIAWK